MTIGNKMFYGFCLIAAVVLFLCGEESCGIFVMLMNIFNLLIDICRLMEKR